MLFLRKFITKPKCYFNGKITNINKINLSHFERAINYGDSIFETIKFENNLPRYLIHHFNRLTQACHLMQINFLLNVEDLESIIQVLCKKNQQNSCLVKIIVSRGGDSKGYLPLQIKKANVLIKTSSLPNSEIINNKIMFSSYIRGHSLTYAKTANSTQFVMAKIEADDHNCFDGLMLNEDGYICEFSSGNVFWQKDGQFYTPCLQCNIVDGVMRLIFIKQLIEQNIVVNQGFYTKQDILNADKIHLTNTNYGVVEVVFNS